MTLFLAVNALTNFLVQPNRKLRAQEITPITQEGPREKMKYYLKIVTQKTEYCNIGKGSKVMLTHMRSFLSPAPFL